MSMDARDRMIDAFTNDPAVTVFLMSLKAGGVALNLTAASHVMLLDPWWCGAEKGSRGSLTALCQLRALRRDAAVQGAPPRAQQPT